MARSVKPRTDNSLESLAQDSAEVIYKGKSPYEKMFIYFILTFALGLMGTLIVPDTKGNWLPLDFSLKEQMSAELQTTTSITSFLYCLSVGGKSRGSRYQLLVAGSSHTSSANCPQASSSPGTKLSPWMLFWTETFGWYNA